MGELEARAGVGPGEPMQARLGIANLWNSPYLRSRALGGEEAGLAQVIIVSVSGTNGLSFGSVMPRVLSLSPLRSQKEDTLGAGLADSEEHC